MITRKFSINSSSEVAGDILTGSSVFESGNIAGWSGVNIDDSSYIRLIHYLEILPSTSYTLSNDLAMDFAACYYTSTKTFLDKGFGVSGSRDMTYTFTSPSNAKYIRLRFKTTDVNIQVILTPSGVLVI